MISLRGYLFSLCMLAMILALIQSITPKGAARKIVSYAGGLALLLTALGPLLKTDGAAVTQAVSDLWENTKYIQEETESRKQELLYRIIKAESETYILEQADRLGMAVEVEIVLCDHALYPYPTEIFIKGQYVPMQRRQMEAYIADNLQIPRERQKWEE